MPTDAHRLDPATASIVNAIDELARSIVPTVDPPLVAEQDVSWALPNRLTVVELHLVDRAQPYGVLELRVPPRLTTEEGYRRPIRSPADIDAEVGAAIRGRVRNLPNPPKTNRSIYGSRLGDPFTNLERLIEAIAYLLFRAPRWQQLATLAIPVWFSIATLVDGAGRSLARGIHGLDPAIGGWLSVLVGFGGWALTAAWLARRVAATPDQRAAWFESVRHNTLSLGCLGMIAWLGGAVLVGLIASALVTFVGAPPIAASIVLLAVVGAGLLGSIWMARELPRRYPPPPQTTAERLVGRILPVVLIGGLALIVWLAGTSHATVRPDQVEWCLGPGAATLERSIATRPVERTWTAETAATDPNFASACSLAWDATH